MSVESYTRAVMEWADILGDYSEERDRLTRRFATAAMRQADDAVAAWMRGAGMAVRLDNIGNLIGRYEANHDGAKTLLLGSHLDTVRGAGKYDGPLGVLLALACVQRLHDRNERLPFAIEILGFADEEGVRYHTGYLGSTVVAGTFDPAYLELLDADSISMREAIMGFGGDPDALAGDRRDSSDLLGYLEVHIEQGPVLEAHDLPVGVVTAIQGQSRFAASFGGEAGHAGTVPMALRRDALCAAAEVVLAVEALARQTPGLVATVGQLTVQPGASNVIPGQVMLSLDVRHQDDAVRAQTCQQLHAQATHIAETRRVAADWQLVQEHSAVPCSPELSGLLAQAITTWGCPVERLPSGAGHDAAVMAAIVPIAMLFVRCKGGISHNPAESVTVEDVAVAIEVVNQFWTLLAQARPERA
jgi:allantoate deiminase